ncbi:hypothetical protein SVIOM342S_01302 [Streptomyces violaceorubidus]
MASWTYSVDSAPTTLERSRPIGSYVNATSWLVGFTRRDNRPAASRS